MLLTWLCIQISWRFGCNADSYTVARCGARASEFPTSCDDTGPACPPSLSTRALQLTMDGDRRQSQGLFRFPGTEPPLRVHSGNITWDRPSSGAGSLRRLSFPLRTPSTVLVLLSLGPSPSTLVGDYQTKGGGRGGSMFLKKLSGSSAVPASVDSSSSTLDLPKPCTCTGERHWLAVARSQLRSILLPFDLQLNKSLLTSLVPLTPII